MVVEEEEEEGRHEHMTGNVYASDRLDAARCVGAVHAVLFGGAIIAISP